MRGVFIGIVGLLLFSCEKDSGVCRKSEIEPVEIELHVNRLEEQLFKSSSKEEVLEFLGDHPSVTENFLHVDEYPSDTVLAENLFGLIKNPFIDTLYYESNAAFDGFDQSADQLEDAFARFKSLYPDWNVPVIETMITGLSQELFIDEDRIIIGLDFFIGENASYKPQGIPNYILTRYDREHLPVTVCKFLTAPYITRGNSETLLSEMIDFGKTYYLISQLMPCVPDSIIMGYTLEETKLIEENEAVIWANFLENEILYETNHMMKRKFLGERPNVFEISQKCPGRIGAWVGWQIVKSYMDKTGTPILELLKESDHTKIFSQSGYKPKG